MKPQITILGIIFGFVGGARPQESSKPEVPIIQQLGSTSYREREKAARELTGMGRDALPLLRQGLTNPNLEIRVRCEQMLPRVELRDLQRRLDLLLKDSDDRQSHDLPLWSTYRTAIGADPAARKLYAQMIQSFGVPIESVLAEPGRLTDFVTMRSEQLFQDIYGESLVVGFRGEMPIAKYDPTEIAGMLLLMSHPGYQPKEFDWQFSSIYSLEGPFSQKLRDPQEGMYYRKLFFHYIREKLDENLLQQTLWTMCQLKMTEGAELLVQALGDKRISQPPTQAQILAGLGILGNRSHLASVEKFLNNSSRVQPMFLGRGGQRGEVQLRDVALAVTIHLSGKDPREFGFVNWRVYPQQVLPYHQLGFTSDDARKQAFDRWERASKFVGPVAPFKK